MQSDECNCFKSLITQWCVTRLKGFVYQLYIYIFSDSINKDFQQRLSSLTHDGVLFTENKYDKENETHHKFE